MPDTYPLYITRITVTQLFGMFNYVLGKPKTADHPGRIAILYGDNGSGKTTILRLIFHLLAPEQGGGHKSLLARIPFATFEITFSDNTKITANRPGSDLIGSYIISIKHPRKPEMNFEITAKDGSVGLDDMTQDQRVQVVDCLASLQQLNLGLYFMADDRSIELSGRTAEQSAYPQGDSYSDIELATHGFAEPRVTVTRRRRPKEASFELLDQSISRFTLIIKNHVLRAASVGESSVNELYNEILHRLVQLPTGTLANVPDKSSLESRIRSIETRSKSMAKYGFGPAFSGEKILRHIHSTGAVEKLNIMSNVVSPYLDSLERRLDALKSIYTIVDNFTEIINSFFTHKHVTLDVGEGITIMSEANDTLNPFALSSGERHLLLIFCNTMIALDNPSIIIIDEPEISLNIKWQRALISSLWKIIETRPIQYIFATHSLELITQYRDRVLTLSHKEH